jgi:DNA-binding transcriptional MerR regulator
MRQESENPKFTASDVRKAGGISYRQLNDWDSKGALPSQREKTSGWRKFDPKRFFIVMVCAEIRKQFGVPIEKLAWLQKFMLQDGANHFLAAVEKMKHGLAVLILTDLTSQFDMDADHAIGELLSLGYCRYDKPQSYVLLLVNPLVNKMLAALKDPVQLQISDTAYNALVDVQAARQVGNEAELAVLETMRQSNCSKFTVVQMGYKEVLLEIYENVEKDGTVQKDQITSERQEGEQAAMISRKILKKVTKEKIGIIAVKMSG